MAPAGSWGWARGKVRYLSYLFLVFFSAVKPGVGQGKGKILKLLISSFLFRSPGSPDQDWHRLISRGWVRGKVRYLSYLFLVFLSAVKPGVS